MVSPSFATQASAPPPPAAKPLPRTVPAVPPPGGHGSAGGGGGPQVAPKVGGSHGFPRRLKHLGTKLGGLVKGGFVKTWIAAGGEIFWRAQGTKQLMFHSPAPCWWLSFVHFASFFFNPISFIPVRSSRGYGYHQSVPLMNVRQRWQSRLRGHQFWPERNGAENPPGNQT